MPRSSARIYSTIWSDPDFLALSAGAQRMYILALSQPNLSLCGVVSHTAKRWARLSSDGSVRAVTKAVKELEQEGFVVVDDDTEELWIRTFVKHDGVLKSPNAVAGMKRDFGHIHSQGIREGFLEGLPQDIADELAEPSRMRDARHPLPPPLPEDSSSSGADDEGSLRSEAEKRLRDRQRKPGLDPIVDTEAWLSATIEGVRCERARKRPRLLESAAAWGALLRDYEDHDLEDAIEREFPNDDELQQVARKAARPA